MTGMYHNSKIHGDSYQRRRSSNTEIPPHIYAGATNFCLPRSSTLGVLFSPTRFAGQTISARLLADRRLDQHHRDASQTPLSLPSTLYSSLVDLSPPSAALPYPRAPPTIEKLHPARVARVLFCRSGLPRHRQCHRHHTHLSFSRDFFIQQYLEYLSLVLLGNR